MQLVTIYGLLEGKSWSYRYALAIPLIAAATNWTGYILTPTGGGGSAVASLIWIGIISWYLKKDHVKEYLNVGRKYD
jgi:hypothetical protein